MGPARTALFVCTRQIVGESIEWLAKLSEADFVPESSVTSMGVGVHIC